MNPMQIFVSTKQSEHGHDPHVDITDEVAAEIVKRGNRHLQDIDPLAGHGSFAGFQSELHTHCGPGCPCGFGGDEATVEAACPAATDAEKLRGAHACIASQDRVMDEKDAEIARLRAELETAEQERDLSAKLRDQSSDAVKQLRNALNIAKRLMNELLASQRDHQSEYYINTNAGCAIAEALERMKGDQVTPGDQGRARRRDKAGGGGG